MSLTAYVRYDNKGRIVPGGPIVTSVKPKVGDWVAISDVLVTTTPPNYKLRAFVRYINRIGGQNNSNKYVAGSLILQHDAPKDGGNWKEVYFIKPCESCNTTTTTTTTCVPFINSIIISEGSLSTTNGTYIRTDPSSGFTQVGGPSFIFNSSGDGWYINSGAGNAAKNTSTLGTGSWVPWAPGNSSGIIAEYIYQQCTTTTSTTSSSTTSTTSTTTSSTTSTTSSTSTTSTTTTIAPLYNTINLAFAIPDDGPSVACSNATNPLLLVPIYYEFGTTITENVTFLYYDTALTNPVISGYYSDGTNYYAVNIFGLVQVIGSCVTTTTTTTTIAPGGDFITTEGSDPIITEGGDNLIIE
jgi:hypothetical protein